MELFGIMKFSFTVTESHEWCKPNVGWIARVKVTVYMRI